MMAYRIPKKTNKKINICMDRVIYGSFPEKIQSEYEKGANNGRNGKID
jgi:hypothetical protein